MKAGRSISRRLPRVAIVAPWGAVTIIPTILGVVESLADHGYGVDLYVTHEDGFPHPDFPGRDVRVILLASRYYQQGGDRWHWRWQFISQWIPLLVHQDKREHYGCWIGCDPFGLILANIATRGESRRIVYFSVELYFMRSLHSPYLKVAKLLERRFSQSAALTITQDEDRAALLAWENGLDVSQIALLPNAALGPATIARSNYLREWLGIADERPIILYTGTAYAKWPIRELIENAKSWDSGVAFVLHVPDWGGAPSLRALADNKHVYATNGFVPNSKVPDIIASADIGIALYSQNIADLNEFAMGKSSGKIARYLQSGLPVVVTALPGLSRLVKKYRCGASVDSIQEVWPAICSFLEDLPTYSQNAIACFEAEFAFDKYFAPILERIQAITG